MKESSCSKQGVYNFIALLKHNGFIAKQPRLRADGARRSNDYWLLFDRTPAEWIPSFKEETENNSPDEASDTESEGGGSTQRNVENAPQIPPCVPPESAPCTSIYEPSDSNRQSLELKDGRTFKTRAPQEFSSTARLEDQRRLQAAEEARKQKRIPVIEGSRPWDAQVKAGHSPLLVGNIEVNGKRYRGWYFETLYPKPAQAQSPLPVPAKAPPSSTGPPSSLMSPEDEEELSKNWG